MLLVDAEPIEPQRVVEPGSADERVPTSAGSTPNLDKRSLWEMRKPHLLRLFGIGERHTWGALPDALLLDFRGESESRAADVARHQVYDYLHAAARAVGLDSEGFGPHTFRRANITWRQQVGGSAVQAGNIARTATGATAGDGASRGSSAGRRPPPSLRTPGRLRMTAVDAVTSPVGVCLGNRFPTANIAKTAGEPRITASRLPDTNTYSGIRSAAADLMCRRRDLP